MYKDIEEHLAKSRGMAYTEKYVNGLPMGLELPNGVVVGT